LEQTDSIALIPASGAGTFVTTTVEEALAQGEIPVTV
jgi:hypothetical protein